MLFEKGSPMIKIPSPLCGARCFQGVMDNMSRILILVSLCAITLPARADIDWVSLVWHNDMFVFRDGGGYTNGAYISLFDLSDDNEGFSRPPLLTRPFLWLVDNDDPEFTLSVYTLGQAMVTPKDISKPVPDPNDAPYAGLLLLRSSFISVHENRAHSLSSTIGIIGPSSGAEEMQKFIHEITDSTEPQGWDYQIKDEFIGQVQTIRTWRFHSDNLSGVDMLIQGQAGLGNLESSLGAGVILRAGKGLQSSFASAALITGRISNPVAIDGGWYVYAGATMDYVHNQIIINGNTFRDSPSGDLRHEQYTFIAGVAYSWRSLSISLALKDGNAMDRYNTARQQFGAITLGWRL